LLLGLVIAINPSGFMANILQSQIWDSLNLENQVPLFILLYINKGNWPSRLEKSQIWDSKMVMSPARFPLNNI
jgi:hypothetical protein